MPPLLLLCTSGSIHRYDDEADEGEEEGDVDGGETKESATVNDGGLERR
jgi:hypothetical protein